MNVKEEHLAERIYEELKGLVPGDRLEEVIFLMSQKAEREKKKAVVTLARSPSPSLKKFIEEKVVELFGRDLTLDYKIKPEIVGGFTLEANGKYYDYSLDSRINSLFKYERPGQLTRRS